MVAILAGGSPASAQQILESFSSSATVTNNSLLGQCNQLRARLYGAGSITVAGNGHAAVATPAETDAALLHNSAPLPSAYKVSVEVTKIYYTQYAIENGVTLLTIANTAPLPANDQWWDNYRMLGVEISTQPGSPNQYPIYVNYWDSSNMYTWNGTQWGVGDPAWQPVLTFDPTKTYTVEIEKANNWYTIRVLSGTTLLTQATVPVPNVRPATTEYFVVGDRLTNYFKGTMQINAISMPAPPGCNVVPDAGPDSATLDAGPSDVGSPDVGSPDVGSPDVGSPDMPTPDASSPDGAADTAAADTTLDVTTLDVRVADLEPETMVIDAHTDTTAKDQSVSDSVKDSATRDGGKPTNDGGPASWDLFTPDMGATPDAGSGCDCRIGSHASPQGLSLLLLLLVILWRRQSR